MHAAAGPAWAVWLEATAVGTAMRQWLWLYPIVEIVHIVGFIVLVGAAFMFDLRLLGLGRAMPVSALADHLLRWARWALVLVVPTGAAFLNAGIFHRWPFRAVGDWDTEIAAPRQARLAGVLSLGLWTGVVACGRLLAYF